jgi:aminoglycoside phosphotransferase (APT) family kinase protein
MKTMGKAADEGRSWSISSGRWAAIQLLAGHPSPERCLVLTSPCTDRGQEFPPLTFGRGTSNDEGMPLGTGATALTVSSIGIDSIAKSRGASFDVIYVTPAWLCSAFTQTRSLASLVAKIANCLAPDGCLVVKVPLHLGRMRARLQVRLFSGQQLLEMNGNACGVSLREMVSAINGEGLDVDALFYVSGGKHLETYHRVVNASLAPEGFVNRVFGDERDLASRLRKLPLRAWLKLRQPIEQVFSSAFVVARRSGSTVKGDEGAERLIWAKVTGRAVTSVLSSHGKTAFLRSSASGTLIKEAQLLQYLRSFEEVATYINPPCKEAPYAGLPTFWYEFLPGYGVSHKEVRAHRATVEGFLAVLSAVPAPKFLEPAAARLGRYMERRVAKFPPGVIDHARKCLARLDNRRGFRWIVHGELGAHNLRIHDAPAGTQVKVIDWPQSYRGHPLLDWWMFLYWSAAPERRGVTPPRLRMGLSDAELDELWLVWRVAYGISESRLGR